MNKVQSDVKRASTLSGRSIACVAAFADSSWREKARTKGKSRERMGSLIFCHLCPQALARLPLAWKETEKIATQASRSTALEYLLYQIQF